MLLRRTSECRHGRALGYGCREMDWAKRTLSAFGPGKGNRENRAATAGEKAEANVKVDREVVIRRTVPVTSTPRREVFAVDQTLGTRGQNP